MLLILFAAIPGGILTFSCFVCSVCSRFIHTGDDGHMRLKCCGKYVTGIGMLVCPMLYFSKHLSLVFNKQGQRTMKMAIRYFWPFSRFRVEGQKLGPLLGIQLH